MPSIVLRASTCSQEAHFTDKQAETVKGLVHVPQLVPRARLRSLQSDARAHALSGVQGASGTAILTSLASESPGCWIKTQVPRPRPDGSDSLGGEPGNPHWVTTDLGDSDEH